MAVVHVELMRRSIEKIGRREKVRKKMKRPKKRKRNKGIVISGSRNDEKASLVVVKLAGWLNSNQRSPSTIAANPSLNSLSSNLIIPVRVHNEQQQNGMLKNRRERHTQGET